MKTVPILLENALAAYNKADAKGKELLANLFGKDVLSQKITDRVKTFEDACEVKGVDPVSILPYKAPANSFEKGLNAMAKMMVIAEVLQEGWQADFGNSNQYKYYPWYEYKGAGFGFSITYYGSTRTGTTVGSRLCFPTIELAEYFGKQFLPVINEFLNQ
jgi:hypothetical protein